MAPHPVNIGMNTIHSERISSGEQTLFYMVFLQKIGKLHACVGENMPSERQFHSMFRAKNPTLFSGMHMPPTKESARSNARSLLSAAYDISLTRISHGVSWRRRARGRKYKARAVEIP